MSRSGRRGAGSRPASGGASRPCAPACRAAPRRHAPGAARPSSRFSRGAEVQPLGVRAPDQAAYVDTPLVGPAEHLDDLAARLAGQLLVGVALPVGEEHQVAGPGRLEPLVELGEVGRSVDQRPTRLPSDQAAPPGAGRRAGSGRWRAPAGSAATARRRSRPSIARRRGRSLRSSGDEDAEDVTGGIGVGPQRLLRCRPSRSKRSSPPSARTRSCCSSSSLTLLTVRSRWSCIGTPCAPARWSAGRSSVSWKASCRLPS